MCKYCNKVEDIYQVQNFISRYVEQLDTFLQSPNVLTAMLESNLYCDDVVFSRLNVVEKINGLISQASRLSKLSSTFIKLFSTTSNLNITTCSNSGSVYMYVTHNILYKTNDETIQWYTVLVKNKLELKRYNYCSPWLIKTVEQEIIKDMPIVKLDDIVGEMLILA